MEINNPYRETEYEIDNDLRQRMDAFAIMEMAKTNLFTEDEINDLRFYVGTWMGKDMKLRTGLTPNKTAKLIGVAGETVRSWIKKGKVEAYKDIADYYNVPYQEVIRLKRERQ